MPLTEGNQDQSEDDDVAPVRKLLCLWHKNKFQKKVAGTGRGRGTAARAGVD